VLRFSSMGEKEQVMLSVGLQPTTPFPGQRKGWQSRCLICGENVAPHFSTITSSVKSGKKSACSSCGSRKAQKTRLEKYLITLPLLLKAKGFQLSGPYSTAKTKTTFACTSCDKELSTTSDVILRGGRTCSCKKRPNRPLSKFAPKLAKELFDELNQGKTGDFIGTGTRSNVWWKCSANGHIFDSAPANRVRGAGCRYCKNMEAYPGENDLQSSHPGLLKELSRFQPPNVKPHTLLSGSSVKVRWACKKNSKHEYLASPYERISARQGCSVCAGKQVLVGDNDLKSCMPEIALEWDYEGNFPQVPENFTVGSNKVFQWQCGNNPKHKWKASIGTRAKGHGCEKCARLRVGFNDLASRASADPLRKHLLTEWSKKLNNKTTAEIAFSDNGKYWWNCSKKLHAPYQATSGNRWFSLSGCPSCAPSAYSTTEPGRFYFLQNNMLRAMKFGITNTTAKTDRVKKFKAHGWKVEKIVDHPDGLLIKKLETAMLHIVRTSWGLSPYLAKDEMLNMGGFTETFSSSGINAKAVIKLIELKYGSIQESMNSPE